MDINYHFLLFEHSYCPDQKRFFITGCPLKRNLVRTSKNYVIILKITYSFYFIFSLYFKNQGKVSGPKLVNMPKILDGGGGGGGGG